MDLDFIKLKSCIFLCIFCLSKLPLVAAHLIVDIDLACFMEYYHHLYVCNKIMHSQSRTVLLEHTLINPPVLHVPPPFKQFHEGDIVKTLLKHT